MVDTINYLNGVFRKDPSVAPVITSPLTINITSGTPVNYLITADNTPNWFDASGLPSGLFLNNSSGRIQGKTTDTGGSPFSGTISSMNGAGIDTQNITINVAASGYINENSVRTQKANINCMNAINPSQVYRTESQAWSHSFWLDRQIGSDCTIYSMTDINDTGIVIYKLLNNRIGVSIQSSGGGSINIESTSGVSSSWVHVAITYSGNELASGLKIYFDNVLQSTSTNSNNLTGSLVSGQDIYLAFNPNAVSHIDYYDGWMDEYSVYDIELTSGQITAIYNAGNPNNILGLPTSGSVIAWWRMGDGSTFPIINDDSTNSNNMTLTNCTVGCITNNTP